MNGNDMILRPTTPDDLELLLYWDEKPHVIESGGDDDDFDWEYELPRSVSWREMFIAEVDGRPIGIIQIIDPAEEETHYWGAIAPNLRALDIWIGEEDDLGKGYGSEMMRLTLKHCFASPEVTAVIIDPLMTNTDAIRFYQRMGFEFTERRQFDDETDCAIHKITRQKWQETRT